MKCPRVVKNYPRMAGGVVGFGVGVVVSLTMPRVWSYVSTNVYQYWKEYRSKNE